MPTHATISHLRHLIYEGRWSTVRALARTRAERAYVRDAAALAGRALVWTDAPPLEDTQDSALLHGHGNGAHHGAATGDGLGDGEGYGRQQGVTALGGGFGDGLDLRISYGWGNGNGRGVGDRRPTGGEHDRGDGDDDHHWYLHHASNTHQTAQHGDGIGQGSTYLIHEAP